MKNIVCVIGARGGSKGLSGKNIRPLLGKPMIAWSIEQALACQYIKRVIVSTDSEEIANIAKEFGAEVPFYRPHQLANDSAGKWEVWEHALDFLDKESTKPVDIYVDLDCTSPLRDIEDISNAIDQFNLKNKDAVFSICEARKNPYFNMIEVENNNMVISKELPNQILCRQDAPRVYEHVASIYILSPEFIRSGNGLLSGETEGYLMPVSKSFDVDSELDFQIVEFLMKKKLNYS